jgi:hypothetical protein
LIRHETGNEWQLMSLERRLRHLNAEELTTFI